MKIGFIGNFQSGYVGEQADEVHLAREMEMQKHHVFRIPRDEWREYVIEGFPKDKYRNVPEDVTFDILIFSKWHHFYDGSFIKKAREKYKCPVFYWVWDYMYDNGFPDWHLQMAREADLYLTNEYGIHALYEKEFIYPYYFPFDVADGTLPIFDVASKKYDVTFFGSYLGQGDRIEWLTEINKVHSVKIFSWNWEEWKKRGFDAEPAVYGEEFNRKVSETKICLGFSVEPNCWGYWSNRVGKTLLAGGFLLYQYAPGMELFLRDGVEYFSSVEEAIDKIDFYLIADVEREKIARNGWFISQYRFSSQARVQELMIMTDRFLKGGHRAWSH